MTTPIEKFTGLANIYAKHRPGYPPKSIDFVINTCNLGKGSCIADVGAGTGIATKLLAKQGISKIYAVEPNQDMATVAQIERRNSGIANDTIIPINASAEETGLDNQILDAVLSAQAFHWFDPQKALKEFHRILKPDGYCILMWNVRDEIDSFTKAYGDLMYKHSADVAKELNRGVSGKHLLLSNLFESMGVSEFANKQVVTEAGLVGRAVSTSYAPRDEEKSNHLKEDLHNLFRKHSTKGSVTLKYTTSVYIAKKVSS